MLSNCVIFHTFLPSLKLSGALHLGGAVAIRKLFHRKLPYLYCITVYKSKHPSNCLKGESHLNKASLRQKDGDLYVLTKELQVL